MRFMCLILRKARIIKNSLNPLSPLLRPWSLQCAGVRAPLTAAGLCVVASKLKVQLKGS